MNYWLILFVIDILCFVPVFATVAYLTIFAFLALFEARHNVPTARKMNRFIILIPAYKEDKNIEQTVKAILGQSYPQRLFDVTVISDHQSEITNMKLAQYPITLLTPDFEESTKAKSLQYAILNLPEFKIYDIVLLLDADNIVEPEFLTQMNNAYETAGTKAIQAHRVSRNRDTAMARLDAIFEEINNSIFRRGHIAVGLPAATMGSGIAYDFVWFKENIMKVKTAGEDKELEALLMRQHIYVDYFEDIYVYDEKKRRSEDFNQQHKRWTRNQFHSLLSNIKYLPWAILNRQYPFINKLIQWMLIPRMALMAIIMIMSLALPFIYFTLAIKWWIAMAVVVFAYALATPDYLVDETWDKTFLRSPLVSLWGFLHMWTVGKSNKVTYHNTKA